jgi:type IV pilus assembly protein PilC
MYSAGFPLLSCIETLIKQSEDRSLRTVLSTVAADLRSGKALSDAMAKHPKVFNPLYCSMVKAGQAGGVLDEILTRLSDYQEKSLVIKQKVQHAMAYPLIIVLVSIAALAVLMTFVVPVFAGMLNDVGAELPMPTQMVLSISSFARQWGLLALVLLLLIAFGIVVLYRKEIRFRRITDTLFLKVPLIGDLVRKSSVSRFARTLGSLLKGGVPITEALAITAKTAGNLAVEEGLLKTLQAVRTGRAIAEQLKSIGIFPVMVVQMVGLGEKTGKLDQILIRISDRYDGEIDRSTAAITSFLEPVMIIGMAAVIGWILIALYMPMFKVMTTVQ